MSRLSYFVHNPKITAETFYVPILDLFKNKDNTLSVESSIALFAVLDTSGSVVILFMKKPTGAIPARVGGHGNDINPGYKYVLG